MLILDDDRLDGMRCSRCRKYLSVFPVKNHPTSREVTCGRCCGDDDDDGGVRSFLYELVAVGYLFRCVNRYEGCGKLLRVDETEAHERLCVGGTFPCPKCEDGVERSALELQWHYNSEHPSSYLRRKNRFDAMPQTVDVKLYVRDDVFAFVSAHYKQVTLHLAATTLTEMDVTQEFSVRGERLWERTETKPCKALSAFDADRYVLDMDSPVSVEVTFDLEVSKGTGLYDVSDLRSSKVAMLDTLNGKMVRLQIEVKIEGRFSCKLNHRGTALLDGEGDEIDLNCSNCKHLIGLPVYRCWESNHQICFDCRDWCGICDCFVILSDSGDLLLTVSKLLEFPCRRKCGAYITSDLRMHERSCKSRTFKCPMCSFVVDWSGLTLINDHLDADHGIFNFLGDYVEGEVVKFVRQRPNGELSFVYNDKCCYLKWSQNVDSLYDFHFGVYGNDPKVQMALIHVVTAGKYLNVVRGTHFKVWCYTPYINFNHRK